jgi:hypothetical protein
MVWKARSHAAYHGYSRHRDDVLIHHVEPFVISRETPTWLHRITATVEVADYDEGFKGRSDSKELDDGKSFAWQRGWAEARE